MNLHIQCYSHLLKPLAQGYVFFFCEISSFLFSLHLVKVYLLLAMLTCSNSLLISASKLFVLKSSILK